MATRTNQRAQACTSCGIIVQPGQGELVHYTQDWLDDNDEFDITPGWHVYCLDHEACKARVETERAEAAAGRAQRTAYEAVKRRLFVAATDGEYPRGEGGAQVRIPEGSVAVKDGEGFDIYGGGHEWRIEPDGQHVWYLSNNGMDGDDWSRNNTRLGIGRRFPMTDERRAFLEPLRPKPFTREEGVRRIAVASRLDPDTFPPLEAEHTRKPDAVWVAPDRPVYGREVEIGLSPDRRWLYGRASWNAVEGRQEDDAQGQYMRAGLDTDSGGYYYVRWPATPERLARIEPRLPAWVGTAAHGRFLVDGGAVRYIADNAADALRAASTWTVPIEKISVVEDVSLVHVDARILIWSDEVITPLSSGLGLKLWSDRRRQREHDEYNARQQTKGETVRPMNFVDRQDGWPAAPPIPGHEPQILTDAGSRLLRLAMGTRIDKANPWDGRLAEFFHVVAVAEETQLDEREKRGHSSGTWWKLSRLQVALPGAARRTYYVAQAGEWSMGEDGDAHDWSCLFEDEQAARGWCRTQLF